MKTLFIAFFLGTCWFLSACKGNNNLEKHEEAVAFNFTGKLDSVEPLEFVAGPGPAEIYKNLGADYLEQGELDKALVEFYKAVQVDPRFVEAHYLLADVYSLKGEGSLSRIFLEKAMELEGSYIIDTKIGIIHETIPIELGPPTLIESTESIPHIFPPEFFEGPIKHRNLAPIDQPQKR